MLLQTVNCPNCGGALTNPVLGDMLAACPYCHLTFRAPRSFTPEPQMGDLLLGADFRGPDIPGWNVSSPDNVQFKEYDTPELWATFPASNLIHPVLRTPGHFDDFDASVSIRFIEGAYEYISAGLELRYNDDGDYVFRISAQGTFQIGWHNKSEWGGTLINWTNSNVLAREYGTFNRLRVIMRGDQLRLYLNGVMTASLRDSHFRGGLVRLVASPGEKSSITVAFTDLELREVPKER